MMTHGGRGSAVRDRLGIAGVWLVDQNIAWENV